MLKRHYEKVIPVCCFLFVFVNVGIASTAFSVHQPYLVAIDGVGDTGGSLILSARTLVAFLAMIVVDRYYRALDIRRGVLVGCLCTTAGFAVYSVADSLPLFMCGAALAGLGYGLGGLVAMTYTANRWFASGIGGVVGFASMGSGVASFVMPLIVVRIIEASSLSAAFVAEGALAAGVGLVVFALLRNRPSDLGLAPFQASEDKERVRAARELQPAPAHERAALMASIALVGVYSCCGITYLSVLATSSGFDVIFAAMLVSVAGVSLTVAKFAAGELFDFAGAPRGTAVMFAFGLVGFALCSFAGSAGPALMVVAAVCVGTGLSLGSVGVSIWSIDLSQPESRARQIKNFQVAYAFGGFVANTMPGIVKDLVGSYAVSYAATFALAALAAGIILRFYRKFTT